MMSEMQLPDSKGSSASLAKTQLGGFMCQYQGVTCELIEIRENFHMTWIHPPRECEERVESELQIAADSAKVLGNGMKGPQREHSKWDEYFGPTPTNTTELLL